MSDALGFICAGVAVVCFGSNFVPVKKFETGDGMFFQWVMCTAIWIAGFAVNIYQGFPEFQPLAMLGGFLWCTGNVMVVPIVKMIGLSLGILLWGTANLVMGWSSGTFGLFGLKKETVPLPALNYVGVSLAILSIASYIFVKSEGSQKKEEEDEYTNLINGKITPVEDENKNWIENLNPATKRIVGITLSIVSGIFYGVNFDPPTYIMDHGGSQNGLDYVFSHFCGIYITSTLYFVIYCIAKKNKPEIYPECVLPSLLSGLLWSIADICWFIANANLNMVVAFPIISTGPGMVASLWGIFAFREIVGRRNYLILVGAFSLTIAASVLITLSKVLK
jgi:glucose uptake protein GlcU